MCFKRARRVAALPVTSVAFERDPVARVTGDGAFDFCESAREYERGRRDDDDDDEEDKDGVTSGFTPLLGCKAEKLMARDARRGVPRASCSRCCSRKGN